MIDMATPRYTPDPAPPAGSVPLTAPLALARACEARRLRLEAAAPALLEACRVALAAFGDEQVGPGEPTEEELARLDAVLYLTHAIAKATGEKMMSLLICSYCGWEDDLGEFDPDDAGQCQCPECGGIFYADPYPDPSLVVLARAVEVRRPKTEERS
jgi:hypothetical protein